MTDEQFAVAEMGFSSAASEFIEACIANGANPEEKLKNVVADRLFDAGFEE